MKDYHVRLTAVALVSVYLDVFLEAESEDEARREAIEEGKVTEEQWELDPNGFDNTDVKHDTIEVSEIDEQEEDDE